MYDGPVQGYHAGLRVVRKATCLEPLGVGNPLSLANQPFGISGLSNLALI